MIDSSNLLAQMGVVVWKLRSTSGQTADQPSLGVWGVSRREPQLAVVALLADESLQQRQLLDKMLQAIDWQGQLDSWTDPGQWCWPPSLRRCLLFGIEPNLLPQALDCVVCPSVEQILLAPDLKKTVWQKIKPLKGVE